MRRILEFNEWGRKKICIFHMPKSSTQILYSLKMLNSPCTIYESLDPDVREDFVVNRKNFCGIIISGGILEMGENLPDLPSEVFESNLPKLGICLGHEMLGVSLGSDLIDCNPQTHGEYGEVFANLSDDILFKGIDRDMGILVKMEHHKMLDKEPPGSKLIASTKMTPVAGFHHYEKKVWGVQFHPEKDWMSDIVMKNFYNYCYPKYK